MQSEDDENLRVEYDSDEFADDEGMSNLEDEDSSSQEYLHDENPSFLADEFRSSSRHKKYTTGECCEAHSRSPIVDLTFSCPNVDRWTRLRLRG